MQSQTLEDSLIIQLWKAMTMVDHEQMRAACYHLRTAKQESGSDHQALIPLIEFAEKNGYLESAIYVKLELELPIDASHLHIKTMLQQQRGITTTPSQHLLKIKKLFKNLSAHNQVELMCLTFDAFSYSEVLAPKLSLYNDLLEMVGMPEITSAIEYEKTKKRLSNLVKSMQSSDTTWFKPIIFSTLSKSCPSAKILFLKTMIQSSLYASLAQEERFKLALRQAIQTIFKNNHSNVYLPSLDEILLLDMIDPSIIASHLTTQKFLNTHLSELLARAHFVVHKYFVQLCQDKNIAQAKTVARRFSANLSLETCYVMAALFELDYIVENSIRDHFKVDMTLAINLAKQLKVTRLVNRIEGNKQNIDVLFQARIGAAAPLKHLSQYLSRHDIRQFSAISLNFYEKLRADFQSDTVCMSNNQLAITGATIKREFQDLFKSRVLNVLPTIESMIAEKSLTREDMQKYNRQRKLNLALLELGPLLMLISSLSCLSAPFDCRTDNSTGQEGCGDWPPKICMLYPQAPVLDHERDHWDYGWRVAGVIFAALVSQVVMAVIMCNRVEGLKNRFINNENLLHPTFDVSPSHRDTVLDFLTNANTVYDQALNAFDTIAQRDTASSSRSRDVQVGMRLPANPRDISVDHIRAWCNSTNRVTRCLETMPIATYARHRDLFFNMQQAMMRQQTQATALTVNEEPTERTRLLPA